MRLVTEKQHTKKENGDKRRQHETEINIASNHVTAEIIIVLTLKSELKVRCNVFCGGKNGLVKFFK